MDNRTVVIFAHPSRNVRDFVDHLCKEDGYRTILSFNAAKTCSEGTIVDSGPLLIESIYMALDTHRVVLLDDIIGNPAFVGTDTTCIRNSGALLVWVCRRRRGLQDLSRMLTATDTILMDSSFGKKTAEKAERWWHIDEQLQFDHYYESDGWKGYRIDTVPQYVTEKGNALKNLVNRLADFYLMEPLYTS